MQTHLLKTFVSNRVVEIQSLCSKCQWRHFSSNNNPADVLSRSTDATDLRGNDILWQGRSSGFVIFQILKSILVLRIKLLNKNWKQPLFKNCLHKNRENAFLTAAELDYAEKMLIKQVQSTTFAKEITALQEGNSVPVSSKLKSLDPFLDSNSILRVGVV
ncbi:hypothetical protein AVEN_156732-1 [Araneus ventricosus]|uniref:Uncharacterized protein n=1 Tax=Araneus ventricosus TaxID=182803 RepID=A0A4Y2S2Z7_ARAVE|nr:hypothetical protein AVEN_156732-1 [Araneus ventricosus]